jgi:hypothetical protein
MCLNMKNSSDLKLPPAPSTLVDFFDCESTKRAKGYN